MTEEILKIHQTIFYYPEGFGDLSNTVLYAFPEQAAQEMLDCYLIAEKKAKECVQKITKCRIKQTRINIFVPGGSMICADGAYLSNLCLIEGKEKYQGSLEEHIRNYKNRIQKIFLELEKPNVGLLRDRKEIEVNPEWMRNQLSSLPGIELIVS